MPGTTILNVENAVTTTALDFLRSADADLKEKPLIAKLVDAVLAANPEGGLLNSHAIADEMFKRRTAAELDRSWEQTKDYVQYMFREVANVCRHADGHHYRVHPEKECSGTCNEKYSIAAATPRRPVCESCFLEVTSSGACSMGCDD